MDLILTNNHFYRLGFMFLCENQIRESRFYWYLLVASYFSSKLPFKNVEGFSLLNLFYFLLWSFVTTLVCLYCVLFPPYQYNLLLKSVPKPWIP